MKRLVEVELSLATVTFCGGFEGTGDSKTNKTLTPRQTVNTRVQEPTLFRSGKIVLFYSLQSFLFQLLYNEGLTVF